MSFGGKLHRFFASPLEWEAGSNRLGDASREGVNQTAICAIGPPP